MNDGVMRIQGKTYATVAHRAEQAHGETIRPTGITSTATTLQSLGPHHIITVTVTFQDGRVFSGSSEVIPAPPGQRASTPAQAAPVENAETSAFGRALAMAGWFGSGSGLAGYEEVARTQQPTPIKYQPGVTPQR
jgi:hypothetical protein